ncbi:MAG: hypothetical protein GC178_16645 [Flavobacteriales bacterium]|nr:hypothetical protein [Flavobacteriales bacterium]
MKVFASNYMEPLVGESVPPVSKWNWEPTNQEVKKIYASGAKTGTRASTYASEKDNEADTDRPNEGA